MLVNNGLLNHEIQAQQIVCLEHKLSRLYAEVIQVVEVRQTAWIRPLLLCCPLNLAASADNFGTAPLVYDLHQASDLLWPIALLRVALDTEVIPLLGQLTDRGEQDKTSSTTAAIVQFRQFIQRFWQDDSEGFPV